MNGLYICYQSITEPLTRTQVVPYLEGLCLAGHEMVLLTFEPERLSAAQVSVLSNDLARLGIVWYSLPYHKRPSVPATAWDVAQGIRFSRELIRRHRIAVVHARGHVAALVAAGAKRLTGAAFIFDVRGLLAEEYVDAGVWPEGGVLAKITKRVERALLKRANGVVVLTNVAEGLLRSWYSDELNGKPLEVIPCCVDLRNSPVVSTDVCGDGHGPKFVYIGKLGGWYWTQGIVDFFKAARAVLPSATLNVYTQSGGDELRRALGAEVAAGVVTIGRANVGDVSRILQTSDVGLSFIHSFPSKRASSPTKIAEYLAAGLPVVSTAGIGDTDALLNGVRPHLGGPIGLILERSCHDVFAAAALKSWQMSSDPAVRARCRAAAHSAFDLETVGWPGYRRLYEQVAAG